jgi:ferritin-like metal-binding protein YciE
MEQMIDLKDLLKHEIMDLHSAEQQIIDALPSMIEKANNSKLKTALKDHLKVTEDQKKRLEELQKILGENEESETSEKRGLFSRLFGGEEKCKGMEGLITEGKKLMGADMSPEVSDAAIIAAAQKIEHYEICGYGTARAYARELNLGEVANKLEQTLNEEYAADDLLTELAVGKVNVEAEFATSMEGDNGNSKQRQKKSNGSANVGRTSARSNGSGRSKSSRSNGNGSVARKASVSKPASKSASSKTSSRSRASLRKTSASNGRSLSSKNVSKKGGNLTRGSSKAATTKRSPSKTSGRSKSSRGR